MDDLDTALERICKAGLLVECRTKNSIIGGLRADRVEFPGLEGWLYHDSFRIFQQRGTWMAVTSGPGMYRTVLQSGGTLDQAIGVVCYFYMTKVTSEDISIEEAVRQLRQCGLYAESHTDTICGGTKPIDNGSFNDYRDLFFIHKPYGAWISVFREAADFRLHTIDSTLAQSVRSVCAAFIP